MSLFVAAGTVSLCIDFSHQSAVFFLPLPSTHSLLSAAGGRSSFINNQCASYTSCQHVCNVVCVCVCVCVFSSSSHCRGDDYPSFQVCWWNKMASQLHVGLPLPANAHYRRHFKAAEGMFSVTVAHLGPIFSQHSWNCWGSQLCSLANFKWFRIWGRSRAFIVFLIYLFFSLSRNCQTVCCFVYHLGGFEMCWWDGPVHVQHHLSFVCVCINVCMCVWGKRSHIISAD